MRRVRRIAFVAATLLVLTAVALGGGACGSDDEPEGGEATITDAKVAAGQVVFNETCTGCHAEDGIGEGADAPNLSDEGLSASKIRRRVADGDGHPRGLASGEGLEALIAYVESIQ